MKIKDSIIESVTRDTSNAILTSDELRDAYRMDAPSKMKELTDEKSVSS